MDVLVGTALSLIIFLAVWQAYLLGVQIVGKSQARITAETLASAKIEEIRNLPYDSIGTVGGIPSGNIQPSQDIVQNGINFHIATSIIYIDDPYDGLAPEDTLNTDYKRARVEVSWTGKFQSPRPVVLITDISPKGVETNQGGGTISLSVFDANGQAVPQTDIRLENASTSPPISLDLTTDSQGKLIIPGAPAAIESYKVIAGKSGYSTDRTYGRDEVFSPDRPHLTVIESQVTEASFSIDKLSALTVQTRQYSDPSQSIANVDFNIRGSKTIGRDENDDPVYKYNSSTSTDSTGSRILDNMEWDSYQITLPENSSYTIAGSSQFQPFNLLPNEDKTITLLLTSHVANSLLVDVSSGAGEPLAGAAVHLSNQSLTYDETLNTATSGQAFFALPAPADYDLEVSKAGYSTATSTLTVSGNIEHKINLNPE